MRELQVLSDGHLKMDAAELQDFFEKDLVEVVRSQLKHLIERALLAERDRHLELGYYEHAPVSRTDYRNGFYFRDLVTQRGCWRACAFHAPGGVFLRACSRAINAASKP